MSVCACVCEVSATRITAVMISTHYAFSSNLVHIPNLSVHSEKGTHLEMVASALTLNLENSSGLTGMIIMYCKNVWVT